MESCDNKTDEELVELSLKDSDHFFCLSKRYEEKLLKYIGRISKFSREDAEDVLQEVFIKTYYNLNGFDPELKFSSWIYRIAHNEAVSAIRKKAVRPTIHLEIGDLERFGDVFDMAGDIDNSLDRKMIDIALSHLDEKYREVLVLRFLDEKDYVEIADILKKPTSTIGNLISRGKKLFKEEYEKLIGVSV
ncbi:MAG: RNA polymerase, sigma-24 subunit, ECF subfamily [Candidatus Nomurabacteria bacterium GW2011_GWF2_35_66]|uniref:RNA polymerase sigma factor n=1 Tax=Candidatus Nomurabacteria bacterium GW2011_GWE1_35_16 TaxID=1618761 RepID=A0A0G0DV22_9BACT|nr:MAG: RNA polymerase, sigma-24 subunit, ECF subfamily [Candidatus Nomurabacteria bacterium GW2011_GWF1_34_20]KKP63658.1 MAG: RNA polymerase, sigma-24 subunit, ECF subfamily [Candidatus Nomurabacteria bacterium GW2011_GWE2_34_25]KKP66860.1 MAG: RNA polymerase, sigma-24 subunit, ECF subfamily [Candidatus Nomurabacteria bacterium GW2011_GWE1_35_16]KKP83486.1 MAG: RNA polymerase, sigma-24 subunit, ECF subfamily [Candidatus Nomurabacteria bacterium GW2011_GWF2_35_66]